MSKTARSQEAALANTLIATARVKPARTTSAVEGRVVWAPAKSIWYSSMFAGGLIGVVLYWSWGAAILFFVLLVLTLCLGHSVGMHRLLIHRSFEAPLWFEHLLVYLGTLVGMAGPIGMFRIHEIRDWQQCQRDCHSFAKHDVGFWKDAFWQMHCEQILARPPELHIEARVLNDRFYRRLEAAWRWQQLPLALVLYAIGGLGFVFWGVCLRVAVSLTGHWCVVHVAHTRGERPYVLENIAVDGRNVRGLGLITFGECWHNNHHAFPRSARMGHRAGEFDPGWLVIRALMKAGLAWNVRVPDHRSGRPSALCIEGAGAVHRETGKLSEGAVYER
jgi:stearoyl-CoA desaturase (delta-9 desaturase)